MDYYNLPVLDVSLFESDISDSGLESDRIPCENGMEAFRIWQPGMAQQ